MGAIFSNHKLKSPTFIHRKYKELKMFSRICSLFLCVPLFLFSGIVMGDSPSPVINQKSITLQAALQIAKEALNKSRSNETANIAIAVVDNAGRTLVLLRDENAPEHPTTTAVRKAWTAVNYKSSTRDLLKRIKKAKGDDDQLVYTDKSLFLMGGVPLRYGKQIVGAIGVSGNPSGLQDDAVARSVAQKFQDSNKQDS